MSKLNDRNEITENESSKTKSSGKRRWLQKGVITKKRMIKRSIGHDFNFWDGLEAILGKSIGMNGRV